MFPALPPSLLVPLALAIVLGIAAQWAAWRLGVPSILLLLAVGFLAGPVSGLVWERPLIDPDELLGPLLLPFVSVAVALILFEGGLTLRFAELGEAGAVVGRLVTVGMGVTWVGGSFAAWLILGLTPALAALLGAVLVVTGPTVIGPLLLAIRPSGRVGAIARWEGIVIDPIGAILAVLVFEVIFLSHEGDVGPRVVMNLVRTVLAGGGLGFASGLLLAALLRWFWVPSHLENAVAIMFVVGVYAGAHQLQPESGLLAATVMGVVLANQRLVDVGHIVEFKENLRVLLISSLFVLLAARVRIEDLDVVGWSACLFLLVLVVVVRPLCVLVSTLGLRMEPREIAFLSVLAPRGIVAAAVASVFALRLQAQGHDGAAVLVPLTFLVIAGTVLMSSLTAPPVARRLGVADPRPQGILFVGAHAWGRRIAEALKSRGYRVLLVDTNRANLAAARMAGFDTYGESILAEHIFDEIDLGGLGRVIAATPNDWINILTVQRFVRVFGRAEVYQVRPRRAPEGVVEPRADPHRHLHGRWLFDENLTHADLARRVDAGAIVKTTPLTAEFTFESYRGHYGGRATLLFIESASKRLTVVTAGAAVDPKPGDTLISLVDP